MTQSRAYQISLQMYAAVCMKGRTRRVTLEQYSELSFEKVDTGLEERFIPEDVVVSHIDLFQNLSVGAIRIVGNMMHELCMNNALWYFKPRNSYDRTIIKELKNKNILLKTEDGNIHFVNPTFARRGSKPSVLACTTKELEGVKKVTKDNIRNLGFRKTNKMLMNQMDLSTIPTTYDKREFGDSSPDQ